MNYFFTPNLHSFKYYLPKEENNNSRKEFIMNKFFKLIGIFFVLSLFALSLTGCMDDGSIMVLKVDAPGKDTSVTTPTVTVSGRLAGTQSSRGIVTINDVEVPVKDLKFSTDVKLTEGKNIINIGAKVDQVDLKEQVTVTYVPAKQ